VRLTGSNTYSGTTTIRSTGNAAWGGTVLSNTTGGVAIPGAVNLGGGSANQVYLRLGADEQIANTSVITFDTSGTLHGRFVLLGRTETVAGLQTTTGRGIAENTDQNDPANSFGPATLILAPGAGEVYSFNGYLRSYFTGGASNRLVVVKNGDGTQILADGNIGNGGGGGVAGLTVNAGTLVLTNTTHANFTAGLVVDGGRLVLGTRTAAFRNPITNNAAGGLAFVAAGANTIASLSGSGSLGLTNAAGAAVTLIVGQGGVAGTYSGDLSGAGGLTKTGTATQVVSGNNTYAGTTTVEQGVLTATKAAALPGYNAAGRVVVNAATIAVRTGGAGEWSGTEIDALLVNATWGAGSQLGVEVSSGTVDLAGNTAGVQGLHKLGAGVLTLSGNNSYSGGTTISAGILSVASTANLPTSGGLAITGGTLRVTGTALANLDAYTLNAAGFRGGLDVADASHTLTVSQGLSGNGWLTKDGAGTLVLSGANTFNGGVTNNAGTLRLANASAWAVTNPLRLLGGDVDLAGYAVTIVSLSGAAGTTVTNNGGLTVNQGLAGTYAGAIVGSGSLTKTGTSTLTLSGANTYTGLTTVTGNGGHLVAGHNGALGTTNGGTAVADGGSVALANGVTVTGERISLVGAGDFFGALKAAAASTGTWAGVVVLDENNVASWKPRIGARLDAVLTVSGDIVDGAGSSLFISGEAGTGRVVLSGTNNTYSGRTSIVRGVLELGRDHTLPAGTRLDMNAAAIVDASVFDMAGYSQVVAGLQTVSLNAPSLVTNRAAGLSTLTVDQSTNLTFAGAIGGNIALIKAGAGALTLQGANAYAGATSVSGGVLRVNGSHTGGGLITVYAGGMLGGTGSVGAVSIQAGGTLGAGNSVGTMRLAGNAEILGKLAVENVGAAVDLVAITGGLTLGPGSVIDLLGTLDGTSSYTILTFTGSRTGTFGDVTDVTAQGYQVDYNANDVTLTVIPEPATLGLLGICAAAALLRRRLRG